MRDFGKTLEFGFEENLRFWARFDENRGQIRIPLTKTSKTHPRMVSFDGKIE